VFNFNGGVLRAARSNPTFMFGLTEANVLAGGAIVDSSTNNITISQALLNGGGGGGLTKRGIGNLTLTGTNTYAGTTLVSTGALFVATAHQVAGPLTVSDNATFGVLADSAAPATVGNVTLGSAAAARCNSRWSAAPTRWPRCCSAARSR
jgi:autotransporter-associated beta strand protein